MTKMNIKKIAEIANVDHSTVSRALSGSPLVRPATKERILQIAKEYKYVRNEIARSLKTRKTNIVGLIVSDIKNPFFTEIISATEGHLARENYNIILCNTNYSVKKEEKFLNILVSKGVDGIVMSPTSLRDLHTEFFETHRLPNVMLDIKQKRLKTNCVYADQELGGYTAISYLIKKGHKRIAFLAGPETLSSSEQAIRGYRKAHARHNIPVDEELILGIPQDYDIAYAETVKLLKSGRRVSAIFALSDFLCVGVYRALLEAKLSIPEDMAVIGYDDLNLTRILRPSLTTVRQPNSEIGSTAAQLILSAIKEGAAWSPKTVILKPQLIIRESA
jgi:LacI family transcriptional regulator